MEAPEGEREEEKRPIWDISHELDRDGLPLVMCGVPATSGDLCFPRRRSVFRFPGFLTTTEATLDLLTAIANLQ